MDATLVLTVIGPDRPGLVQSIAAQVADLGGNWLESRMCRLGGQFAGILRVAVPAERSEELARALRSLDRERLQISVHPETAPAATSAASLPGAQVAQFAVVGLDRPGILRSVTGVFAARGVNVEDLVSEIASAPMGGGDVFQARIKVSVPPSTSLAAIQADLEKIAADLMVDVTLMDGAEAPL